MNQHDRAVEESVLAWLLGEQEAGREPSTEELARLFPTELSLAERLRAEVARYARLRASLRGRDAGSALPLLEGELVGDFEVVDEIARGGMGVVYRARQRSLGGRDVALKVGLRPSVDATAAARFRREALTLADLHHPSMAEVYGFGEERGITYLAMRLVRGPSLHAAIESELATPRAPLVRAELERRVRLVQQVASALAEVHRHGLIHRDVKPTNIVLEDADASDPFGTAARAVLVDFGLVRPIAGPTATLTRVSPATREYASPEQALGESLDSRTDVFSLGATLHDLIAGRSPSARMQASAGLEPLSELVPGVDADLAAIVAKACDPDRRWRYASAVELEADLTAWFERRGVQARRAPLAWQVRRWVARHPTTLLRGMASVGLVLLGSWAAVRASGWVSAARRVAVATREGQLLRAADVLSEIPLVLRGQGWLLPDPVAELQARLGDMSAEDPLASIVEALRDEDIAAALSLSAHRLGRVGLEGDALVRPFYLAQLAPSETERALPQVLPMLGRLVYEQPAASAADLETSAALREHAVAWLGTNVPREGDSLFLLTILAGAGRAEDVPLLVERCMDSDAPVEWLRLGLTTLTGIVCRARACGYLDVLDLDRIEAGFTPLARDRFTSEHREGRALSYELEAAIDRLALALVLARRWRGEVLPHHSWTDAELSTVRMPGEDTGTALHRFGCLRRILAIAGDPRVIPHVTERSSAGQQPWSLAEEWGELCGWYADPDLTAQVRSRCLVELGQALLEHFDAGMRKASTQLTGGLPPLEADDKTLLRYELPPPEHATNTWDWKPSVASGIAGGVRFDEGASVAGRSVRRLVVRYADLHPDHLRAYSPGYSSIEIFLQGETPERQSDLDIVLRHQKGDRHGLPFLGVVVLEIRFNGALLDQGLVVTSGTEHESSIRVDSTLIHAARGRAVAEQTLSLHLLAETTTTWFLKEIAVVPSE